MKGKILIEFFCFLIYFSNIFSRIENITHLLESWFDLYDLLLELHHDSTIEKAYCVFDTFTDDSYCREQIMERIDIKKFEKNHFRIEHLLKVIYQE